MVPPPPVDHGFVTFQIKDRNKKRKSPTDYSIGLEDLANLTGLQDL
jgi:hypothetical protein